MSRITVSGKSLLPLAAFCVLFASASVLAQSGPGKVGSSTSGATKASGHGRAADGRWLTRPERTDFRETSRYEDVIAYMKAMADASPLIHLTTYGYTTEGRPLPLAVIGAPAATPEAVRRTKKTRIYIQGDIHAGEVEGKEAALWLLRSVAKGERAGWLRSVVLLINPIYNADGNERVNVANRGRQNGPVGGMGQRANARDLDLNRDCTKLETAEGRSLARLMTDYDPHIAIDLHTTDGSPHGFYLTYQTSVSPNTSPVLTKLVRGDLLPWLTKTVKAKHGWDYFYYGNLSRGGERAWRNDLDLYKPRYTQTYFGIRNRVGLLVETYSYATFEDRIKADYWFLEEVVNYAVKNGETIRKATAEADAESIIGTEQSVRGKLVKEAEPVPIVLADSVEERNPYVPDRPMLRRVKGSERTEMMPHYAMVEPTETSVAPRAYIFPAAFRKVIDRLEAHGVRYFPLGKETSIKGERFRIETNTADSRDYQNHKMRTLTGKWEASDLTLPAGSIVVPMDQPLARLAFILFDSRSDDGFTTWNLFDEALGTTPSPEFHPVLRTMETIGK